MGGDAIAIGVLCAALLFFLWLDLHYFARGREPRFREAAIWSIGWVALSLLAGVVLWAIDGSERAVEYTTVYLIERSLSLDNLFVFLILFAYFAVPQELRPRLLFWGILLALAMRGVAILVGIELIERFEWLLYVLGALLFLLAVRILRGVQENVEPEHTLAVRLVRRFFPVTKGYHGHKWFVREDGKRSATPLFLCLSAVVVADITFAIDSIPAAFAITRDGFVIWMGNVFALLGLRSLFVLVESLGKHVRYLDETIAVVLAVVGVKLLLDDVVHVGPEASLGIVAAVFAVGIGASLLVDRREAKAPTQA